jgi:hypothetical protein
MPIETMVLAAFDGTWSVTITTDRGGCGPASLGVVIQNGVLQYTGASTVAIRGRVANNGVIQVSVASGDRSASARGWLSFNLGGGTWHGSDSNGACVGRWSASRG